MTRKKEEPSTRYNLIIPAQGWYNLTPKELSEKLAQVTGVGITIFEIKAVQTQLPTKGGEITR